MIAGKKLIILCTSRIYDNQVYEYLKRLYIGLSSEEYCLLIYTINSDIYWDEEGIYAETAIFDFIPYDHADFIIIMDEKIKSHKVSEKILTQAKSHDIPALIVDGKYDGFPYIDFDYFSGFEQIVRHVFENHSVKKPHIMAGFRDNPFSDERIAAFRKVITEYGFDFDESMVSYGDFWSGPAIEETNKLIDSGNIPDVIFCANDIMALNVAEVLKTNGFKIPDDIMVTGFDGYDEVFFTSPKITTSKCTTPELANATVSYITSVFSDSDKTYSSESYDMHLSVIPSLVTNESTGFPSRLIEGISQMNHFNEGFYRHQDEIRLMYEIITNMQSSESIEEMLSHLEDSIVYKHNMMEDIVFVLNKYCFETDSFYFSTPEEELDPSEFSLIFDSESGVYFKEPEKGNVFLSPENDIFIRMVSSGQPVIFNCIDYMNKPLGYVCYNYQKFEMSKYSQTTSITNTINMGIGSFISMNYQRSLVKKVNDMYEKDFLTGLYNRVGFYHAYEKIVSDEENNGKPVSVIMSDLDGLKTINDTYGHAEGDIAIATAANALLQACPENAISVRFGGDELFSVIVGECNPEEIISKIEKYLKNYNNSSGKEYSVITSCGAHTTSFDSNFDIKKAMIHADKEMYEVKKTHYSA